MMKKTVICAAFLAAFAAFADDATNDWYLAGEMPFAAALVTTNGVARFAPTPEVTRADLAAATNAVTTATDAKLNGYLPLTGGTMGGVLDMYTFDILNAGTVDAIIDVRAGFVHEHSLTNKADNAELAAVSNLLDHAKLDRSGGFVGGDLSVIGAFDIDSAIGTFSYHEEEYLPETWVFTLTNGMTRTLNVLIHEVTE